MFRVILKKKEEFKEFFKPSHGQQVQFPVSQNRTAIATDKTIGRAFTANSFQLTFLPSLYVNMWR